MMQNSSGNSVPHCVDCFTQFEYSQYSPVYDSKQSHLHVVTLLKKEYYLRKNEEKEILKWSMVY
jgi:transposase-like protein